MSQAFAAAGPQGANDDQPTTPVFNKTPENRWTDGRSHLSRNETLRPGPIGRGVASVGVSLFFTCETKQST